MKFQRVLSIILSLSLSVAGICAAAPAMGAYAAEEQAVTQDQNAEGPDEGEADPKLETEAAEPAGEIADAQSAPAAAEDTYDAVTADDTENADDAIAADDTENADDVIAADDTENADDAIAADDTENADDAIAAEDTENADDVIAAEDTESADDAIAAEDTESADDAIAAEDTESADDAIAAEDTDTTESDPASETDSAEAASDDEDAAVDPAEPADEPAAEVVAEEVKPGQKAAKEDETAYYGVTDLSNVTISGITDKTYEGGSLTQNVSLTYNGKTLVEGIDYLLSYENNTLAGTATMTFEGLNDFTGTVTRTFTIKKAKLKIEKGAFASKRYITTGILKKYKKAYFTVFRQLTESTPVMKLLSVPKKAKKYIKLNKKTGQITVKKGIKTGKYKIKIRLTVPESQDYVKGVFNKTITLNVKKQMRKKYTSLKKLGVKGYSDKVDKSVNDAFELMLVTCKNGGTNFDKLSGADKAYCITTFIGSRYYYKDGSYNAESMLKKGYGTCFAYSDLTYLMAKKAGLKKSWLTVPGRNVDHGTGFYGSRHRSVVTQIGKKYYELDSNKTYVLMQNPLAASVLSLRPERITKSYARYLIGKSKKYTSITPKK